MSWINTDKYAVSHDIRSVSPAIWRGAICYSMSERRLTMMEYRQRRLGLLIAAIAIGIALLCLLVPHSHPGDGGDWLAILPLLFVGVLSPLSLLPPLAYEYSSRALDAPALPTRFQRPPPIRLA